MAVLEAGSFTAAADRLGISKKLVSKYVAQLEAHLHVRLLNRTTRTLSPTEAGLHYLAGCKQILAELDALEGGLVAQHRGLSGSLRITAPVDFGARSVVPAMEAFQDLHPDVTLDLNLTDRHVDLAAEGFDLAIRIGKFDDSSLITRKLGTAEMWLVASPVLLDGVRIDAPEDLKTLPLLQDTNAPGSHVWQFETEAGTGTERVTLEARLKVNSALVMRDLALRGRGVAPSLDVFVRADVAAGRLIRLLPHCLMRQVDIRAVYLSNSRMPERLRALIGHLTKALKQERKQKPA